MMGQMTTDEIAHWIGELTAELARRAAEPAQPALPPFMQAPRPAARPQAEPKARPFTQTTMPVAMAPMPSGGLAPGTPLTAPLPAAQPNDQIAALMAQVQALMGGQQAATPAPQRGIVTVTAKTDPETARVFMGVPPRPDGVPPINGAGVVAGAAVVEPA